jgi:hypothetical protein
LAKPKTKRRQKQLAAARKKRVKKQETLKRGTPLVTIPKDPAQEIPIVDLPAMYRAIAARDSKVWDGIISYLTFFQDHHYRQFGTGAIMRINEFVAAVFAAVAVEDFVLEKQQAVALVQLSHIFHHLVATSSHRTTDAYLDSVLPMQSNVPKLLFMLNPRGEIQPDQRKLFDVDPFLSSIWFLSYMMGISSPTKVIQANLYRHLHNMDERFIPPHQSLSGAYFSCTYHHPESAKSVKKILNAAMKKHGGEPPKFTNNPDPKSIAIVTNKWHRNHAVYKSASPLVEQLVGKYKLTLIWTGPPDKMPNTAVTSYFDKVIHCYFSPGVNGLHIPEELQNNDFQMIYFPDIGMSDESIWMSNFRMAPIQAVGYGHPDTTGEGNEIDYFIGGDVEKHSTDAYAETMVLLPGLAQEPAWPVAPRQYNHNDDDIVRVNCVWGPDKYNHTLLTVLAEINKRVAAVQDKPTHEFHLFASPGINRYAALPPFTRDVMQLLPNAIIHSEQEYFDYMENAEMHDFSMNSFPFGCYNVLIESLYMGLPFLTLVGDRFYNRAGMWLNEQVGMEENNFADPQKLIGKAVELITNPDELQRQRDHLASLDLKDCLFTLKGEHFLEAVEYIIGNHPFNETKIIGESQ